MFRDTKSKLLKAVSILLLISGLFILFLVIAVFFNWEILEIFLPWFEVTGFFLSAFALPEVGRTGLIFPVLCIVLAFIDLLCAFYVYKGNRVFRSIAVVRSFLTSLSGIGLIYLAYNSKLSIIEGLFYLIYYGVIFIFLELSRRKYPSAISK